MAKGCKFAKKKMTVIQKSEMLRLQTKADGGGSSSQYQLNLGIEKEGENADLGSSASRRGG